MSAKASVPNQMDIGDPSLCESIWIKISINSGYVVLGNVYRPPKSNINLFLGSLENILATLGKYVVVDHSSTYWVSKQNI